MMDYYSEYEGPNKNEVINNIEYEINKNIKNLKYINITEKKEIIKNIINNNYKKYSYTGWLVFQSKELYNLCYNNINKLEKKREIYIYLKLSLIQKKEIDIDIINNIYKFI